jgi:hypothetical protein
MTVFTCACNSIGILTNGSASASLDYTFKSGD